MQAVDAPQGLRQAALALHSLTDTDHQKVWSRLSAEHQARLSPLLSELKALGIPKGRTWLNEPGLNTPGAERGQPEFDVLMMRTAKLKPQRVYDLAQGQSIETMAMLLSVSSWPWKEPFLQLLSAADQQKARAMLSQGIQVPAAMALHLLQALHKTSRT